MNKNRPNNALKPNELSEGTKVSMKVRVITAIVGVAAVIPFIFLGDWFYAGFVVFLSIISTIEIVRCSKVKRSAPYLIGLIVLCILVALATVFWPFLLDLFHISSSDPLAAFHIYNHFTQLHISVLMVFIGFALLFTMVVFHSSFTARDACFLFTMLIAISLGLQSLSFIRYYPSYLNATERSGFFNLFDSFEASLLLIYVLIGTFATDIGAYFFGVFFGRKKINERISPKKTYAGFIGGIVVSFLCSTAFGLIVSACGHPLLAAYELIDGNTFYTGYLDLNHWYYILLLSAIIPFFATLGDFVFSSVKRYYEIKDFGNILPGHGGILDRIDSLVFSLCVSAMFVWIITNLGSDLLFLL